VRLRGLLIGGAVGLLGLLVVGVLAGCGGSGGSSSADFVMQREADKYEIGQIEKSFHEAMSKKDIDLLMSVWAPNATLTYGPGLTVTGKTQIRETWLKSTPFKPATHWVSSHPAYKLRVTVSGDQGTLHFECHFIDFKTGKVAAVTAADQDVARIGGRWLVTNMVGGTAELKP
jgi:ketosteroid isomerase-like protein